MDRFTLWRYSSNRNCWDFVREFLIEKTSIPADDLPKFGVLPSDKRGMTNAANGVIPSLMETEPVDYSIACQYLGDVLYHVGVVLDGMVNHVGEKCGSVREPIKSFENFGKVKYFTHEAVWPR